MTNIPPPRYKIVERKGRIIVTDTWAAGGRPSTPMSPAPVSRPRPSLALASAPAALLRLRARLVALACLGASDDAGRPILSTSYHVDEKGPRSIALSETGAARLGNWMLGALGFAVVAAILIMVSFVAAVILIGGVGLAITSANTTARPAITKWLDTLGDTATKSA